MIQARKKRNSSRVNLIFSVVFHALIILAVIFFAAHEGILGKRMKQLTATLVSKEKPPEPPKQKPPEPKLDTPKVVAVPKAALTPEPPKEVAAAPPVDAPPAAAPPAVDIPTMQFDGGKEVQSVSDPNVFYKGLVETALRTRWNRPEDLDDQNFVADVEVTVDTSGELTGYTWVKGSGNQRWDDSVKNALAKTKSLNRPPPKNFPEKIRVRFDVESMRTEDAIQLGDVGHP